MYDINDKAAAVREIQRYLTELHYNREDIPLIRIDGLFGEATRRAVTAFQRGAGIPETGAVDHRTWQALYKEYRRYLDERLARGRIPPDLPLPATLGSGGEGVLNLQRMMNALGERYRLSIRTDLSGVYSYATEALASALRKIYRMQNGTGVTGELYGKMLRDYGYPARGRE